MIVILAVVDGVIDLALFMPLIQSIQGINDKS